jgi:hypothetical protein
MVNCDLAGVGESGPFPTFIQWMAYVVLGAGKKRIMKQQMGKHQ